MAAGSISFWGRKIARLLQFGTNLSAYRFHVLLITENLCKFVTTVCNNKLWQQLVCVESPPFPGDCCAGKDLNVAFPSVSQWLPLPCLAHSLRYRWKCDIQIISWTTITWKWWAFDTQIVVTNLHVSKIVVKNCCQVLTTVPTLDSEKVCKLFDVRPPKGLQRFVQWAHRWTRIEARFLTHLFPDFPFEEWGS